MMYSHTPALRPVVASYHVSILNDELSERLRSKAPGILEGASIRCPWDTVMHVYGEQGEQIDPESDSARWSPAIVLAVTIARRASIAWMLALQNTILGWMARRSFALPRLRDQDC